MSEKKKDDKNRWRNKTIAFRGSPEEAAELDKRWKLCGYATKQDYLIDSMLHQQPGIRNRLSSGWCCSRAFRL